MLKDVMVVSPVLGPIFIIAWVLIAAFIFQNIVLGFLNNNFAGWKYSWPNYFYDQQGHKTTINLLNQVPDALESVIFSFPLILVFYEHWSWKAVYDWKKEPRTRSSQPTFKLVLSLLCSSLHLALVQKSLKLGQQIWHCAMSSGASKSKSL